MGSWDNLQVPRTIATGAAVAYALSVLMPRTARNGCSRIPKLRDSASERQAGNGSSEFLRIRLPRTLSAYAVALPHGNHAQLYCAPHRSMCAVQLRVRSQTRRQDRARSAGLPVTGLRRRRRGPRQERLALDAPGSVRTVRLQGCFIRLFTPQCQPVEGRTTSPLDMKHACTHRHLTSWCRGRAGTGRSAEAHSPSNATQQAQVHSVPLEKLVWGHYNSEPVQVQNYNDIAP